MALLRDDHGLSALLGTDRAERIATGCSFTEGPVWHRDGYLLFSDIPRNRIHRWSPADGLAIFREPSGQSNGLTFDGADRLVACEHATRRVSRTGTDGVVMSLVERFEGKRLNSPNDCVVHSSGAIYFTDPPYGVPDPQRELGFQGVYRLAPDGQLSLLADDFDRPNGIALSPDEQILYVDDTARMHVRAFDVAGSGVANNRVFAEFNSRERHGCDGLKVDTAGRVYATGGGGCFVWEPDGSLLGVIVLPEPPANVGWGDLDWSTLYFTARASVYRVPMKVQGLPVGPARLG